MAGFVWKRAHTIAAASTAVVLVGVVGAVAITGTDVSGTQPPPATASSAIGTPSGTPSPTVSSAAPRPNPINPLTGKRLSGHKVIAVKVENIAAARPQVGLNPADIVFAEEVEGSLTRLIAVYHTTFPPRVGPVRSARNTDVGLLPMFGEPGLVYSGANRRVQANIDRSPIVPIQRATRDESRVAPHNVFVNLNAVADKAKKVGRARDIGWTFAGDDPRWDAAAKDATVTGRVGGDTFSFTFAGGRYAVGWNGNPYTDGDTGEQAVTDNVVILSVKNRPDGNSDVTGARSVKSITTGKGKAVVYRDGRKLGGTWRRAGETKPMRLVAADGKDISLAPGKTWVLLSG